MVDYIQWYASCSLPSDMAWNKYVAQLYHWTNDRVCKNFLSDFLKMPQYVPTFQLHQVSVSNEPMLSVM